MVTGGTGSFGHAVVKHLLREKVSEIRILSRDEAKQDAMRRSFSDRRLKFYIGDVRDRDSLKIVMSGANFVFHAAALKQVPSCEFYPLEAIKTNIIGTENVLDVASNCGVEKIVCLSTDKAVYPINSMGMSKALMEKVMVAKSRMHNGKTVMCATRYGNVMGSRGSVIPLFQEQLNSGKPLTITNPSMTRFMMTLDDAVSLVMFAFEHGVNGDIFVQKSPAATIDTLVSAMKNMHNVENAEVKLIGTRHGEKLYETLCGKEEMYRAVDLGDYYKIPCDDRGINYELYFSKGANTGHDVDEYNSHNTRRLTEKELIALLRRI